MVRFLLLIFLVFTGEGVEAPPVSVVYPSIVIEKPHHFLYVYNYIRQNIEGNYSNHPNDRGRETYAGISRRLHPDWFGWQYVDEAKPLVRHDSVPAAEIWALDFYLDIWVNGGFEVIENREVALSLFDFTIHSSPRTVERKVNNVLREMGCGPIKMGEDWVDNRFNQVDPTEFILRLKIQRLILFNYIVTHHPSQRVFYEGWLRRISNI